MKADARNMAIRYRVDSLRCIDKVADELLQHCLLAFGVESGSIFTKDPYKAALHLVKATGARKNYHCGESVRLGEGVAGSVALRKEALHFADECAGWPLARRKEDGQVKHFLSFPIMSGNELLAVVNLSGPHNGHKLGKLELPKCKEVSERYADMLKQTITQTSFSFSRDDIRSIRRKEKRFPQRELDRQLPAHLPYCVLGFDSSFRITSCNRPNDCQSLLGINDILKPQASLLELPLGIEEGILKEKLEELAEEGTSFRLNNIRMVSARDHVINVVFCPISDAEGRFRGGLAVLEDNTCGYEVQQKLIELERLSLVGSLTSMVTHELNNPLDGVIRLIKLSCMNSKEGKPSDEYLAEALNGLQRMSCLMKSLLGFARINAEPLPLNAVVESVVSLCRCKRGDKNISFDLDLDPINPPVNSSDFHQVFANLLSNAIDAIVTDSGTIQVKTSLAADSLHVKVLDTGCGIPYALQARIFDAFWTTKEYGKGTGLGLAIVKRIVERHGGTIHIESDENAGTTFHLIFPEDRIAV